jgi:hypothetical protein
VCLLDKCTSRVTGGADRAGLYCQSPATTAVNQLSHQGETARLDAPETYTHVTKYVPLPTIVHLNFHTV